VLVEWVWKKPGEQDPARSGLLPKLAHDDDKEYHRHHVGNGVHYHVVPPSYCGRGAGESVLVGGTPVPSLVFFCNSTIQEHSRYSSATAFPR
jgi:hypothetical protein